MLALLDQEAKGLDNVLLNQRPVLTADGLAQILMRSDSVGEVRGLRRLQTLIDARKSELESKLKLSNDPVGETIDKITANHPTD